MSVKEKQIEVFRHELKYFISRHDHIVMANKLKCLMDVDTNADDTGDYHIRSLYFDDYSPIIACNSGFLLVLYDICRLRRLKGRG